MVRPESAPKLLTSPEQRLELLEASGVDATVVLHFDEAQSKESAESFIERVLIANLAVKIVGRRGLPLRQPPRGQCPPARRVRSVPRLRAPAGAPRRARRRGGGTDQQHAIRRALAGGDVDVAARMLGRPHEVRGKVVMGDQRGRLLGFPTANVEVPNSVCMPADGVYAGWYQRPDGVVHPCAINLGRRPTFYEHADHSLLEAHLLDFDDDLYGEQARVSFGNFPAASTSSTASRRSRPSWPSTSTTPASCSRRPDDGASVVVDLVDQFDRVPVVDRRRAALTEQADLR